MNGRAPSRTSSSLHSTSNTSKTVSCRLVEKKTNLTASIPSRISHRRKRQHQQLVVVNVVDLEKTSVSEHGEGDDEQKEKRPMTATSQKKEDEEISRQREGKDGAEEFFSRLGICAFLLSMTMVCILLSYFFIEQLNETQLLVASVIPVLWSWGQQFASLRLRRIVQRFTGLCFRVMLLFWVAMAVPYRTKRLIFQQHRGVFPICALFTVVTVLLHFLVRPSSKPDSMYLGIPETESVIVVPTDNPETFKKMEKRFMTMSTYISQVVILPLLQEILYRGVIVFAFAFFYRPQLAAAVGALCFNCCQSYENTRTYLAQFVCGIVWGLLFLSTNGNLMYPFVAHLMHNTILFGIYHYQTIIDCF